VSGPGAGHGPILTEDEIDALYAEGAGAVAFARKIEAAVWAKIERATVLLYADVVWVKKP